MSELGRCPWYVAGPLLGLLIIAMRALMNKPLGALGGYIELAESRADPRRLGFRAYLLLGIMLGGATFAVAAGSFSPAVPNDTLARWPTLILAGVVMGFGARRAGGTSGHGMSGMSLGSPASIVSTITFFATAVLFAHLLQFVFGGAR